MTISSYNIAKAILRTKSTYIIVQLRYFGNNLSRRSNIVIVNNNNNIVIVTLEMQEYVKRIPGGIDRVLFTFEEYVQGKTYVIS